MSNCYNSELPIGPPGPTGPIGQTGAQGLNGTVWLNGPGEPDPELGVNNDYYLDTDTGELYIKEYFGLGLRWVIVTDIYGEDGEPGIDGENGVALQWIESTSGSGVFKKSLGISPLITTTSTGLAENFYSTFFYILGTDLCPLDDSVARITIFYEATGTYPGGLPNLAPATVVYNLTILNVENGIFNSVAGGPLPSAKFNNTSISIDGEAANVFTKVCYTIRRKSISTAEILTEWSTSSLLDEDVLHTASGNYYSPAFLTVGRINFADGQLNEFKFNPTIVNSTPSSNPQTRALSFYIEKLR